MKPAAFGYGFRQFNLYSGEITMKHDHGKKPKGGCCKDFAGCCGGKGKCHPEKDAAPACPAKPDGEGAPKKSGGCCSNKKGGGCCP